MTSGGIVFDGTINLGNILTIFFGTIVWAVTIAIAWTKFGGRMDLLEFRTKLVEDALKAIAEVLKLFTTNEREVALLKQQVAALEVDYATLNATVEDLRRGNGWYQSPRRDSIDGEYS